jgi:hypothetical protein
MILVRLVIAGKFSTIGSRMGTHHAAGISLIVEATSAMLMYRSHL